MDILSLFGMKQITIDPSIIAIALIIWRFDKRISSLEIAVKEMNRWNGLSRGSQNRPHGQASDL